MGRWRQTRYRATCRETYDVAAWKGHIWTHTSHQQTQLTKKIRKKRKRVLFNLSKIIFSRNAVDGVNFAIPFLPDSVYDEGIFFPRALPPSSESDGKSLALSSDVDAASRSHQSPGKLQWPPAEQAGYDDVTLSSRTRFPVSNITQPRTGTPPEDWQKPVFAAPGERIQSDLRWVLSSLEICWRRLPISLPPRRTSTAAICRYVVPLNKLILFCPFC